MQASWVGCACFAPLRNLCNWSAISALFAQALRIFVQLECNYCACFAHLFASFRNLQHIREDATDEVDFIATFAKFTRFGLFGRNLRRNYAQTFAEGALPKYSPRAVGEYFGKALRKQTLPA